MKIFSTNQIYEADKFTIQKQNIAAIDLMERAGEVAFNWLHSRLQGSQVKIHVFCGVGNNGGDGLVISRHLITHGYNVETYIVNFSENRSKDFLTNLDRVKDLKHWPSLINCIDDFPALSREDIIVDAIFGIGLNRNPTGCTADLFSHINKSQAFILAIDIPSGLFMDKIPEDPNLVIYANYVLSFQTPKLAFFLPKTGIYLNEWEPIDIGLDPEFLYNAPAEAHLIEKHTILQNYIPRAKFSHKGTYGHGLIIGGSYGKIGAVYLTSKACLSSGAGLVTSFVPKCGYTTIQTSLPEVMVLTDSDQECISEINFEIEPTVIAIGIGMGTHLKTVKTFKEFLSNNKTLLVLDADAINILSKDTSLLNLLPAKTIVTPHPGELERLIGPWKDDFEKLKKVKELSKKHDLIIVIKEAHTMISYQEHLYVNNTGNPGMATAGSGDVLTGIITGLLSQGYEPLTATIFGVYLHGKAGDIAVLKTGYQSLIASSIIDHIGDAFTDLFKQEIPQATEQQASTNQE